MMEFFDTSHLSKTEKDFFQILPSIYEYELTKSQPSHAFIPLPEKVAIKSRAQRICSRTKN